MHVATRSRIRVRLGGLCLLVSALCYGQVQDVALKAAFIYNFALFTNWPQSSSGSTSFNVCVVRGSPMWDNLQKLSGKLIGGRPWTVHAVPSGGRKTDCDLAVLSDASEPFTPASPSATLVVRDGGIAGKDGAAITLIIEDNRIHFDIDTVEAQRNGLRFSSKLLSLARNVL
jgi:YfiR/HmsC-like